MSTEPAALRSAAGWERRLGAPQKRPRLSIYGVQLREKQLAKAIYGVSERQFRRYYEQAARHPGDTGENLMRLLERRLDNVVYRLGFARTRPMARQLVGHGHVDVNDRKVTIPSYLVHPGETIRLRESATQMPTVTEELTANRPVPDWLGLETTRGHVRRLPDRADKTTFRSMKISSSPTTPASARPGKDLPVRFSFLRRMGCSF